MMAIRVTSKTIARLFPMADLSGLAASNPGGGKVWNNAGLLSIGAAFAPAADSAVVHKAGAEDITGQKRYSGGMKWQSYGQASAYDTTFDGNNLTVNYSDLVLKNNWASVYLQGATGVEVRSANGLRVKDAAGTTYGPIAASGLESPSVAMTLRSNGGVFNLRKETGGAAGNNVTLNFLNTDGTQVYQFGVNSSAGTVQTAYGGMTITAGSASSGLLKLNSAGASGYIQFATGGSVWQQIGSTGQTDFYGNVVIDATKTLTAGATAFSGDITLGDDKSVVRAGSSLHKITLESTGRTSFQSPSSTAGFVAYRFKNGAGTQLVDIYADGVTYVYGRLWPLGGVNIPLINTTTNTVTLELRGAYGGNAAGNAVRVTGNGSSAGNYFPTSGTQNVLSVGGVGTNEKWIPSSGNATWNGVVVDQEINTSGTYSGTVRGFYFNPTRTAEIGVSYVAFESSVGSMILNSGDVTVKASAFSSYRNYLACKNASGYEEVTFSQGSLAGDGGVVSVKDGLVGGTGYFRMAYSQGYTKLETNQGSMTLSTSRNAVRIAGSYIDYAIDGTYPLYMNSQYVGIFENTAPAGTLHVNGQQTTVPVVVLKQKAASTVNVLEIRNSVNAAKFIVDKDFNLILAPAASITPASNGQLTFEATSNTQLTFKLKGSDGVVRSGALALA